MKKLLLLIRVLSKCRHTEKPGKANEAAGDTAVIFRLALCIGAAVFMFFAGRYIADHADIFGSGDGVFLTVMMMSAIASMFLAFPTLINQLYMSNDLDVLVSMPFTPMQIVTAKLVSASGMPLLICCGITIPAGIGYGITLGITNVMYWVGLVLGSLMVAVTVICIAAMLVMVIMRLFRRIRSRNVIAVFTALLTFGLTMAYVAMPNDSLTAEKLTSVFQVLQNTLGGAAKAMPMIGMSIQAMFTPGAWLQLVYALLCTLAVLVLMLLIAKAFYFAAALGMTDANKSHVKLNDAAMSKATRAGSLRKALFRREMRNVLRTPSLITNGYLTSLVMPLLILVPMAFKLVGELKNMEAAGIDVFMAIRELIRYVQTPVLIVILEIMALMFAVMAVGMSSLSRGIISREGKDFASLKAMPIPMTMLVSVKRGVCARINGISGVGYSAILCIAGIVMGILPAWSIAVVLPVSVSYLFLMLNICSGFDLKRPNLNWENEADACRNNTPGVIIFLIVFVATVAGAVCAATMEIDLKLVTKIIAAALPAIGIIGALVSDRVLKSRAKTLAERF